jgi:hypothetical protein
MKNARSSKLNTDMASKEKKRKEQKLLNPRALLAVHGARFVNTVLYLLFNTFEHRKAYFTHAGSDRTE